MGRGMRTRTLKRTLTLWTMVLSIGSAVAQSTTVNPVTPTVPTTPATAPTGPSPSTPPPTNPPPALPAEALACPLPRKLHQKPTKFQNWGGLYQDRVVFKLMDDLSLEPGWSNNGPAFKEVTAFSVKQSELQSLNAALGGLKRGLARQHASVKADTLVKWRKEAEQRSCESMADLNQYYRLYLAPGESLEAAVTALNASPLVEIAFVPPIPRAAADPLPITPSFESNQGYLAASTSSGIGAREAWRLDGARGAGVRVIDVEATWNLNHEDLPKPFWTSTIPFLNEIATALQETLTQAGSDVHHGTAVAGELVALDDKKGVVGIAPEAEWGAASVIRLLPVFNNNNLFAGPIGGTHEAVVSDAILESQDHLRRGDVILIEQHSPGPESCWPWENCGQRGFVPMEYFPDCFDAIKEVTALGTIVVEAAGNGNVDLDSPRYNGDFDRKKRDSGAIMVGATAGPGTIGPNGSSNSGSRLDVSAWGAKVWTTAYGDSAATRVNGANDPNQFYTSSFGGTSSASPMVAAAALAVQGAMIASEHGILTPPQMRDLLTRTGTAQQVDFFARPIGPLVNIAGALSTLETATASAGGIGGWDYTLRCPEGLSLIGIKGRADGLVDSIRAICGTPYGGQQVTASAGGPWGYAYEQRCPVGKVVVGLGGRAGAFIDALEVKCDDPLDRNTRRVETLPTVGGTGGWSFGPEFCPRNRVGVGLRGTASVFLHRIQLLCAEVDTAPPTSWVSDHVGGMGGTETTLRCNTGEVLVGVAARHGWVVHSLQARCSQVNVSGAWIGSITNRGSVGGGAPGGEVRNLQCPNGQAVSGISGRTWWYLDRLTLHCRDLNGIQQVNGASTSAGSIGGTGGDAFERIDCPANLPARGFVARGAGVVDGLKLMCGR